MINKGSFGEVYDAIDRVSGKELAIKIEKTDKEPQLPFEALMYRKLQGSPGIFNIYEFGFNMGINYLVMDKGDYSLQHLIEKKKEITDKNIVKTIAVGLIISLQGIHNKGFIHRDIKPQNIIIKQDGNNLDVYIIDFGLSSKYTDAIMGHNPYKEGKKTFAGTPRYASVNIHHGIEPSRRDDLESMCYTLIYMMRGKLPWQHIPVSEDVDKYRHLRETKLNMSAEELTKGLPPCIYNMVMHCKQLKYDEQPNYQYLIDLFK